MFKSLSIRTQLFLLIGGYSLLMVGGAVLGISGMYAINRGLETVYSDRTVPLQQLAAVEELLLKSRLAVANALIEPSPDVIRDNTSVAERNIVEIDRIWGRYMATFLTPEEKKLADKFAADRQRLVIEGFRPAIAQLRDGRIRDVEEQIRLKIRPLFEPVDAGVKALIKLQIDVGAEEFRQAGDLYTFIRNIAILGVAAATIAGMVIGTLLVGAVVNAIRASVRVASRIAQGELDNRVSTDRKDELGELIEALRTMNDGLRSIVREVRDGAGAVASASSEIARGNADLSSRTEEQASTLEETASSMEELTTTVKQNAENAAQASQLAAGASDVATRGGQAMAGVVTTMEGIAEASRKIAEITAVIDGIAFQTNILALNAAVEAARAGEQGRGFAVVASEVRALAQRSAAAAKEIKTLIQDSVGRATEGTKQVQGAGETISQIVTAAKRVTDVVAEIAAASREQLSGIEQVNRAVTQMDQVVQQNAALVEESSAAAEHLASQADGLVGLVSKFKLDGGAAAGSAGPQKAPPPAAATKTASPPVPARQTPAERRRAAPPARPQKPGNTPDGDWKEF